VGKEVACAVPDKLYVLSLIAEPDLPNILRHSPYANIREEAFEFIETQVEN